MLCRFYSTGIFPFIASLCGDLSKQVVAWRVGIDHRSSSIGIEWAGIAQSV